jgi:hypothetical protein
VFANINQTRLEINWQTFNIRIDSNPSIAWKVNNLTAIFSSLTAVFMFLTSKLIVNDLMPNKTSGIIEIIGIVFYSFSLLTWEYSISAEVFALNNCLCSIIIYLTCKTCNQFQKFSSVESIHKELKNVNTLNNNNNNTTNDNNNNTNDDYDDNNNTNDNNNYNNNVYKLLYLIVVGAFFCGLTLTNQHASLITISIHVLFILYKLFSSSISYISRFKILFLSGLFFLCGLTPYVVLYKNSLNPTRGSWGDLTTVEGFLNISNCLILFFFKFYLFYLYC